MDTFDNFSWLDSLILNDEIYLKKLKNSLYVIKLTTEENLNLNELKESIDFVFNLVQNERYLSLSEIRRLVRYIRRLLFLDSKKNSNLKILYDDYLINLVYEILFQILNDNNHDQKLRKNTFLISLFSDYYDDLNIFGINFKDLEFSKIILNFIIEFILKLKTGETDFRMENFYQIIYIFDKLIINWLDIIDYCDIQKLEKKFVFKLKKNVLQLIESCMDKYKIIVFVLSTTYTNLKVLSKKI